MQSTLLCDIYLLRLTQSINDFKVTVTRSALKPLVIGTATEWMLKPHTLSVELVSRPWDIFLLVESSSEGLPAEVKSAIASQWKTSANISSSMTESLMKDNHSLLNPSPDHIPPLTGSLQKPRVIDPDLEVNFTPEIEEWTKSFSATDEGKRPVSMLNLLAYNEGKRDTFLGYIEVFNEAVGAKRGAMGKLFGSVPEDQRESSGGWEDIALVHYPSIWHFADLIASEEYRECDRKYKQGAVKDCGILCITSKRDTSLLS
ncbi:hypothetical protein BDY21DRAFT_418031 [Lineolata rhizophorae]|uniref:DUF1330 domain-containing protein n=1 Tax=Lineolata rhizophorae TaxID=578093 RepID=A0A6A6PDZ9_9PEZI|nr:hypothetical protein BDY21DRAFT_418031 [Lineolata rhizophorae]